MAAVPEQTSVTYAEVRTWAIWLDRFTASDLADVMGVSYEVGQRGVNALLWHGIWTYVVRHKIDAMIGCTSFEGTNADKLALPLSFLHHHVGAPEEWRVQARASRYRHAARHLLECSSLAAVISDYGSFETHAAYAARLRAEHGRKIAFWELAA